MLAWAHVLIFQEKNKKNIAKECLNFSNSQPIYCLFQPETGFSANCNLLVLLLLLLLLLFFSAFSFNKKNNFVVFLVFFWKLFIVVVVAVFSQPIAKKYAQKRQKKPTELKWIGMTEWPIEWMTERMNENV